MARYVANKANLVNLKLCINHHFANAIEVFYDGQEELTDIY